MGFFEIYASYYGNDITNQNHLCLRLYLFRILGHKSHMSFTTANTCRVRQFLSSQLAIIEFGVMVFTPNEVRCFNK